VCRSDQPTAVLQKAIDFSCGDGANCSAILQGGACYSPDTVASHCSWAANSYYQNNKAKGATCDFDGAATVSTTDPSNFTTSSSTPAGRIEILVSNLITAFFSCMPGFSGCTFPPSTRYRVHIIYSRQVTATRTNNSIVCLFL
jgi:hypothetical protein